MNASKEKLEIEKQIDLYIEGKLNQEEIDDLWAELVQHQEYMDYLHTAANLNKVVEEEPVQPARKISGWMYAAAAAVLLLVIALGGLKFGYFNTTESPQAVQKIELDYYRSAVSANNLDDHKEVIRKAIALYNEDKFEQAIDLLNTERKKATDIHWIAELNIALGTFCYNKDKFNDSAYYFENVIAQKSKLKQLTVEKAYWYLGNAYFQMDLLTQAEKAMKQAYKLNGAYSRPAKTFLNALADFRSKRKAG